MHALLDASLKECAHVYQKLQVILHLDTSIGQLTHLQIHSLTDAGRTEDSWLIVETGLMGTSSNHCTFVSFHVVRFIVPEDKVPEFEDAWHQREDVMQQSAGFLGFSLERKDDSDFVATSKYAHTVLSAFASPARFAGHFCPTVFSV